MPDTHLDTSEVNSLRAVCSSDCFLNMSMVPGMLAFHKTAGKLVTMAVCTFTQSSLRLYFCLETRK